MYPGKYVVEHPDRACFVMADTGETVTYREYDERCNRLAHLLRAHGLVAGDHYSIFMENNSRYLETCGAGERSGLHYTCINSHLTADELAYIVDNSESKVLITSAALRQVAPEALRQCPKRVAVPGRRWRAGRRCRSGSAGCRLRHRRCRRSPPTPIDDEQLGAAMLYSSGTTGRPKGIIRQLPEHPPGQPLAAVRFPARTVALPRGHGVPVARSAVPLGTAGRRRPDAADGRHGDHHGALRSRAVPRADRAIPRDPQPTRADDVRPDAEAARARSAAGTTCRRSRRPSTPRRRARCR